jgi:glucosamine-6-phosphate deaminase
MHKEEGLSFKNVISFNLDEYFPMKPDAPQSYHTFMHKQLFDHVDILPENIHIPDGTIEKSAALQYAADYEAAITKVGGIDYQILGIGLNGHWTTAPDWRMPMNSAALAKCQDWH